MLVRRPWSISCILLLVLRCNANIYWADTLTWKINFLGPDVFVAVTKYRLQQSFIKYIPPLILLVRPLDSDAQSLHRGYPRAMKLFANSIDEGFKKHPTLYLA